MFEVYNGIMKEAIAEAAARGMVDDFHFQRDGASAGRFAGLPSRSDRHAYTS